MIRTLLHEFNLLLKYISYAFWVYMDNLIVLIYYEYVYCWRNVYLLQSFLDSSLLHETNSAQNFLKNDPMNFPLL